MCERLDENIYGLGPAPSEKHCGGQDRPMGPSPSRPSYEDLEARVRELERENLLLKSLQGDQKELEKKLSDVLTKVLSGYLPICARCKRIREEDGVWKQLETYIQTHTEAVFSHSLCPSCARSFYPEFFFPED